MIIIRYNSIMLKRKDKAN